MTTWDRLRPWCAVFALALIVGVSFQGSRGLFATSEGRYAECAREMLESGNFLEPTLGYRHHWTKPPVIYWTLCLGMRVFGMNEWGLRLPNALFFAVTALLVAGIGVSLYDRGTGFWAGAVYATSLLPALAANSLTADTLLTFWAVAAVCCYVCAWRADRHGRRRLWMVGMWAAFGFGFLTKGPPVLLPLIPIVIWNHFRGGRQRIVSVWGTAVFLLTALPWYIVEVVRHPKLLSYWLGTEVFGRVATFSAHNHQWYKGFETLLPPLLLGLGVWTIPLVRSVFRRRLWHPRVFRQALAGDRRFSFLFLWLVVPLAVLMVSRSKLTLYVLPFFAALAVAAGRSLQADGAGRPRRNIVTVALATAALIAIKAVPAYTHVEKDARDLSKLCLRAGDRDAEFYTWNEPKLYGLQFYLNGRLKRASEAANQPWADATTASVVASLKDPMRRATTVLIEDSDRRYEIDATLQGEGLPYSILSNRYWKIYAIPPVPHPEVGSPFDKGVPHAQ